MTEQTPSTTRPGAPGTGRDDYDLVVIVPVLSRPHRIAPLMVSIVTFTPSARIVFVATDDDTETVDACRFFAAPGEQLERHPVDVITIPANLRGDYAIKINETYRRTTEPFMLLAADDLSFHAGWWPAARRLFDDPAIGVVGTNDLGSQRVMAGTHATHPVVRRSYIDAHGTIDEAGKVLHDRYWHEFVDDEFVGTAKHRGAYAHAADSIVEHLHPNWGKAPMDPLYEQQQRRMSFGRRVFNARRHLWNG